MEEKCILFESDIINDKHSVFKDFEFCNLSYNTHFHVNIKLAHVLEYPADGAKTPQSIYMNATQFIYHTYYLKSRSVASPGFFLIRAAQEGTRTKQDVTATEFLISPAWKLVKNSASCNSFYL